MTNSNERVLPIEYQRIAASYAEQRKDMCFWDGLREPHRFKRPAEAHSDHMEHEAAKHSEKGDGTHARIPEEYWDLYDDCFEEHLRQKEKVTA